MSATKPTSWLATTLAVLSFAIACASFYVSYKTHQLSVAEDLSVTVLPQAEKLPVVISRNERGGVAPVLIAPFEATLSNNGNRKLSVVRYEVFEIPKFGGKAWYNNLDAGLVNSNGEPLDLPIILDAGESAVAYLRIGLMANGAAVRVLSEKLPNGGTLLASELFRTLARSGIDIYGNVVKRETVSPSLEGYVPEGYVYEEPNTGLRTQRFSISFQTGKGGVVTRTTSWHRAPNQ